MTSHPAQALTVYPQAGKAQDYVRVEQRDGGTVWCHAKPTFGRGAPHEPWPDSPKLTPV